MRVRIQGELAQRAGRALYGGHLVLLAAGIAMLAYPAFVALQSNYAQWAGNRELDRAIASVQAAENAPSGAKPPQRETIVPDSARPSVKRTRPAVGSVVGKFELPRLGINYVLLEGTDHATLDKSIGHVEDTGMPGENGNIGIAGHRNTHFKKLEWARRGDIMSITTPKGVYRYKVEWIRLFTPEDLYVLDPTHGPAITIITCFPFEYVGSAPQRMVIRALPDEETKAKLTPMGDARKGG